MSSLKDRLGQEPLRAKVIADCVAQAIIAGEQPIDAQVKHKGFVIKAAYATIKTIKRRFVPEVVDGLLNEWLDKIQPHYDRWEAAKPSSFADYVIARSDDVAEDLLTVTDSRAQKTTHTRAKKMYEKMRPAAKKDVIEAMPELSRMIERHLTDAQAATAGSAAPATA
jgi:hypothetical protein